jgi:hypothetical protein
MRYFFNLHECGQKMFDEDGRVKAILNQLTRAIDAVSVDHTDIGSVRLSGGKRHHGGRS